MSLISKGTTISQANFEKDHELGLLFFIKEKSQKTVFFT